MRTTLPAWITLAIRIVVPKRDQETITGDLIENYTNDHDENGKEHANKQLKRNALRSIGPLLLTRLRQGAMIAFTIWRYWHSRGD